ncbi:hypothetical protein BGI33_00080 [Snodgrassella alvi]|uniref:Type IV secretion protein Rhs n=2 Tax=Snodgrassella alvi TaxID=1196083 RepID=A0A2N9WRZ8_9NEIS|nr:hypothetical protein BGI32_11860 [Snodgrassella alvi]PIT15877.1 hypothetical protein BGI34_11155 [Snodgrassella alvi]PIT19018.1 hypothetical protein BGI33_00080 [Snodgrassella alvi]
MIGNHLKAKPRLLTLGEMAMVTSVFKAAITLTDVRVRKGPILPLQGEYAVTPMGEIYWPTKEYLEDYSLEKIDDKHFFMHEMVHVWQYQMGMWVALRGACSLLVDYHYALTDDKVLSDYGMEQQASIIADYYILRDFGYDHWLRKTKQKYKGNKPRNKQLVQDLWLKMYENTLRLFLKNPKDKKALFG